MAQAQTGPYKLSDIDPPAGAAPASTDAQPSTLSRIGTFADDVVQGVGKGFASTANNLGHLALPDWALNAANKHLGTHIPVPSADQQESYFKPANTTQAVGKGVEQAAEFMLPGGTEEELAAKAPAMLRPLARIGASALSSGAVNKVQGGSFGTGAALGAGGAAIGQGLKAAAPIVAETALGIPKAARAFGKTPGAAILDETRGIRPETVAASAQERMGKLTPELEKAAIASPNMADLGPARSVISDALTRAAAHNAEGTSAQLRPMEEHLGRDFTTGQPIPQQVKPFDLLNLKRGFGEEHTRWNPELHAPTIATSRGAYHALDSELDRTVPEAAGLNQRISSLIPVARRAESVSRNAPTLQRAAGRFGARTGALTLGGVGALEGRREGGMPGMIAGGLTGVLAPELIASPEGQMLLARILNKAGALKPAVGTAAQFSGRKAAQ